MNTQEKEVYEAIAKAKEYNQVGEDLEKLIDKFGLPLVLDMLWQVCNYKAQSLEQSHIGDVPQLRLINYWRKNGVKIKKMHTEIVEWQESGDKNGRAF